VQAFCTSATHREVVPCDSTALLLHRSRHAVAVLYNGLSFHLKIAPSHGDVNPHLTHGSLGAAEL